MTDQQRLDTLSYAACRLFEDRSRPSVCESGAGYSLLMIVPTFSPARARVRFPCSIPLMIWT